MSAKNSPNLSHLNINEVVYNKRERMKATYVITPDGSCYYLYKGLTLKEKDFEAMHPIEVIKENPKGVNVDGTHIK